MKPVIEAEVQRRVQEELAKRAGALPATPAGGSGPTTAEAQPRQPWSPAQPITLLRAGPAYMNISFDTLVNFGWSTTPDVRDIQFGDHDPSQRGFTMPNSEVVFEGAVDPYFKGLADIVWKLDEEASHLHMSKLVEMFQQDFMLNVLAGTMVVAAICSYLGVFIVLRRAVFVGAALAQVSSLGVALALFAGGVLEVRYAVHIHVPPEPVALALTVGAAALMAIQYRERRLPRETVIGVAYAAAAALAILVVAVSAHAESEVLNLLFGNVLTIGTGEVIGLIVLAVLIGLVHGLFYKEFLFVSFDPDMAMASGVRAKW